jgi:3-isopropylmalate/(R)-2-methylmalate dehydratase small subunit
MDRTSRIDRIEGRAVAVRGDNIDTDRIVPARFLLCVTFDGLGEHAFEDDRAALRAKGDAHPFDEPRHRGASILVVNRNFGSGSSREHAPQALRLWGIQGIVGESFAEIFFGNCQALGIPCLVASKGDVEALMKASEVNPGMEVILDVASASVSFGGREIRGQIPVGPREAFLRGTWDVTGLLLDRMDQVEATAARLPYMKGF